MLFSRFYVPPILYANARDAHEHAGHSLRARLYEFRFEISRRRLFRRGSRAFEKQKWERATSNLDWVAWVGRKDGMEVSALVMSAISFQQQGDREIAENSWSAAFLLDPTAALMDRLSISQLMDLPKGVPGSQSNEPEQVWDQVQEYGLYLAPKKRMWQLRPKDEPVPILPEESKTTDRE